MVKLHRLLFVQKRFSNDMAMFYSTVKFCVQLNICIRTISCIDLKPENILIGMDGHVVLCDLGFSG